MSKILDRYKIIGPLDITDLQEAVNREMMGGEWIPKGGVFGTGFWFQAMIKKDKSAIPVIVKEY